MRSLRLRLFLPFALGFMALAFFGVPTLRAAAWVQPLSHPVPLATPTPEVQVESVHVTYAFHRTLRVSVTFQAPFRIRSVTFLWYVKGNLFPYSQAMEGQGNTWWVEIPLNPAETSEGIPPFATVFYWFQVEGEGGVVDETPAFTFEYVDDRFVWRSIRSPHVVVHHPPALEGTATQVLDYAQAALERMRIRWLAPLPLQTVHLYLYPSKEDFESLFPTTEPWVGSQALPPFNLVYLPADLSPPLLEAATAHELGHVVLYHAVQGNHERLPWWLWEGIPSLSEPEFRAKYQSEIQRAWEAGTLYPLSRLCERKNPRSSGVWLQYAQAASFTYFLYHRFGARSLQELIHAYVAGASCEYGPKQVYGMSLSRLEALWKQEGLAYSTSAFQGRLPQILLGTLALGGGLFSSGLVLWWIHRQRRPW